MDAYDYCSDAAHVVLLMYASVVHMNKCCASSARSLKPTKHAGDVGVGLNMRRLRSQFLAQFIITYSIRPIGDIGTIFRKYPEPWQVYIQDEQAPGRFRKVAERPDRPAGVHLLTSCFFHAHPTGERD
jgi:Domain of unknown function (DUF1995)